MDLLHALQVRQWPTDDGLEVDQRRLVGDLLGGHDRVVELLDVLGVVRPTRGPVNLTHVPAIGLVALRDILAEGDLGVTLDGDLVVVVDHDEVAQFLGTRQRGGLGLDTLLHAAVAEDRVHEVVEGAVAGGVRVVQTPLASGRHRHTDRVADAGAERAGGALDEPGVPELRMTRRERAEGAQGLDVGHLEPEATQVQLGVLQDGSVPRGQDEAVTTDPLLVGRVGVHDLLVEQVGHWRQRDRGARVPVADFLHSIGGQNACGVDGTTVLIGPGECAHVSSLVVRALGIEPEGRGSSPSDSNGAHPRHEPVGE